METTQQFSPPAPGTQIVQEMQESKSIVLPSQASTDIMMTWPKSVRLVEFQSPPGFLVENIRIGQTLYERRADAEGRRVEKGVVVTVKVTNPQNFSAPCKGMWYTEDATEMVDRHVVAPAPAPAIPQVYNAAAPQGAVQQSVTTNVDGTGAAPPAPSPVPANGENKAHTQTGVGGQQFIHMGGAQQVNAPQQVQQQVQQQYQHQPDVHQNQISQGAQQAPPTLMQKRPVKPGVGEIALQLTKERAKQIAFVLKGGILMPQEVPTITFAIEQAIMMASSGQDHYAGTNEDTYVVTMAQAQRIVSVLKGTDWQEIQGLILRFEGHA